MSDPFIGEIKIVGFNYPPRGFAACNGQVMQTRQSTALFAILGIQYGGDGVQTFNLPNLAGSVAMGQGAGPGLTPRSVGQKAGSATVTLGSMQIPNHSHPLTGATLSAPNPQQNVSTPTNEAMYGLTSPKPAYLATTTLDTPMSPEAIRAVGGGLAHQNLHPFQVVNFVIALQGIYPTRN